MLRIALATIFLLGPGQPETIENPSIQEVHVGPQGHPIIQATVYGSDGTKRILRLLLDTGTTTVALNEGFPESLFAPPQKEPKEAKVNSTIDARVVTLRDLRLGPIELRDIRCLVLPLSASLGPMDDLPVDGIVGMNALHGHSFQLDFKAKQIRWDEAITELPPVVSPLHFPDGESPFVQLQIAGKKIEALCDTGSAGFLQLMEKDRKRLGLKEGKQGGLVQGVEGAATALKGTEPTIPVSVNSNFWCEANVSIDSSSDNSILGLQAFGPSVWFNFKKNQIGFSRNQDGCLPSTPILRMPIWFAWDRGQETPKLIIIAVKPGSPYEKAGIKAGDIVIRAGHLEGKDLGIVPIQQLFRKNGSVSITVIQNGKELAVNPEREVASPKI